MSVKLTLSPRHVRIVRRCVVEGLAAFRLTPDERDAGRHALDRIDRAMAKHHVSPVPPEKGEAA